MDKATKLARIKSIRAAALRAVEEIGSWQQVRMGSCDRAMRGAEIGDVLSSSRLATEVLVAVLHIYHMYDFQILKIRRIWRWAACEGSLETGKNTFSRA
jgi:hypothetical protein